MSFRTHQHQTSLMPEMNNFGWLRWPNDILGTMGAQSFLTFVLQVRKKSEKTSPRKLVLTGDRTRAHCMRGMKFKFLRPFCHAPRQFLWVTNSTIDLLFWSCIGSKYSLFASRHLQYKEQLYGVVHFYEIRAWF